MKTIKNIFVHIAFLTVLLQCSIAFTQFTPIVPNLTPQTDSCSVTGGTFNVQVPTEALSGANIPLNITLPGTLAENCNVGISIDFSQNLNFVASTNVNFAQSGNTLTSTTPLAGNDGRNFNVNFSFPSYVTCNGEIGTFTVTTMGCNDEVCTTTVNVMARAEDYWTVGKQFIAGDLVCGTSLWKHKVKLNNPNPFGQGTYSIQGTIAETTSLPIVSGATHTFSSNGGNNQYALYGSTVLQNCSNAGTTINNTATYNYTLGNGCDAKNGSTTAQSPALAAPNTSISFTKTVYANSGWASNGGTLDITEGCSGRYVIGIHNNGNVPWTNLVVTDNLNIPGLTATSIVAPTSVWTTTPLGPITPSVYTFTSLPAFVLNPGDYTYIIINFTVDSPNTIGNILTNTATINYQASVTTNTGPNTPIVCQGVTCPTLDTAIQNTSATVNIEVVAPTSVPQIKKCIDNPPAGGIYQLGDTISFRILVENKGSGNLTTTVTDNLQLPGQNLQVVPGSVAYSYYENQSSGKNCGSSISNQQPIAFGTSDNLGTIPTPTNLQNPAFQITNMPGTCVYGQANYTVITFDAIVLPQLYGNKTNKAFLTTGQNASAAYTIDQAGVLEIDKMADTQIVENGQNFNYILTVTNSGTVPLDTIVITDNLPSCVSLAGPVIVKDALGATVSNTTSAALTISVNPTVQLLPGDDMFITIPVIKSGSGSCCNITASVTAIMTTSGVDLFAIDDGTVGAPAACVIGTECCDIADFDATITNSNGNYSVLINGGLTPLQEIEIAMVDYHITYSDEACRPSDLGNFGTITTSNVNLSGLLLNASDNGTSSLTWLAGDPAIINTAVNLDVINPEVLNLDCCESTFYFCLKIRVKDVNCNVCEITVCYSSDDPIDEPEPCDIKAQPLLNDAYCIGDTIPVNWTSTNGSSSVDILLVNGVSTPPQVVASGIPNTGSYSYTIPQGFPCDDGKQWSFIIRDSDQDINADCASATSRFTVKCCAEDCECGKWLSNKIEVASGEKKFYDQDQPFPNVIGCDTENALSANISNYTFTAPGYQCNPENCEVTYEWTVKNTTTGQIFTHTGQSYVESSFNAGDVIKYSITPICGGKRCKSCRFVVVYKKHK